MADEPTAKSGAEPENKAVTAEPSGAEPEKQDAKTESSTEAEKVPWDKDPRWKSARLAEKKLNDLLKANEVEDPDDLLDLIESGKKVKGKVADVNQLDEILEKAKTLDKYQDYWNAEEERKKRAEEDPEQTIARLEKKLKAKSEVDARREEDRKQAEQARNAIQFYEREVSGLVKEMEIPKEQQPFVLELFGVGNPSNDINITDRKAIKKLISDGTKKVEAFKSAVIAEYLKGKEGIPKVSSSSAAATEVKPKIMLKDARRMFIEQMQKSTGG